MAALAEGELHTRRVVSLVSMTPLLTGRIAGAPPALIVSSLTSLATLLKGERPPADRTKATATPRGEKTHEFGRGTDKWVGMVPFGVVEHVRGPAVDINRNLGVPGLLSDTLHKLVFLQVSLLYLGDGVLDERFAVVQVHRLQEVGALWCPSRAAQAS